VTYLNIRPQSLDDLLTLTGMEDLVVALNTLITVQYDVHVYGRQWMLVGSLSVYTVSLHTSHLSSTRTALIETLGSRVSAADNACSSSG